MCEFCPIVFSTASIDYLVKVAPILIAAGVAYLGYLQLHLNRATVREKLFDRRFEIFRSTQKFLTRISENIDFEMVDFWEFADARQKAKFLFDDELYRYLTKISDRALALKTSNSSIDDPSELQNRMTHVADRHASGIWLNNQLSVIFDKFRPYLGFPKDF